MSDDRRLQVLRAIVEDFVSTQEPVGSKALVDRHELGVSSATVRNDMAVLEDEGYIVQPHTSAGRIPTDKGYRTFVDRLSTIRTMSRAEKAAIHSFLDGAGDMDSVVERTVRLLAQLTKQAAMVQYPSLRKAHVRHVEMVGMSPTRTLLVLIADTGRVDQHVVITSEYINEATLADLRARLNVAVVGCEFSALAGKLAQMQEELPPELAGVARELFADLAAGVRQEVDQRVVIAGSANLARYDQDLSDSLQDVLEALEEHVILLRLLGEQRASERIAVRIGSEHDVAGMDSLSVVSAGYGPQGDAVGHLGVVGPTRMDYSQNMTAVLAVARYLGRIISDPD